MLYGFLVTILVITCVLLILLILIQQGKSSMGLGNLGGSAQMLFGGSGGQDIFQKATWVLGALFLGLSLLLALMKSHDMGSSRYLQNLSNPVTTPAPVEQMPQPQPSNE